MRIATRRQFLKTSLLGMGSIAAFPIIAKSAFVKSSNERLSIAGIGVGGMGAGDLGLISKDGGVDIVALCDVDDHRAAETYNKFPKARRFRDFRRMLDVMDREIDAVVVATPDHTHAVASIAAMNRGKHVYCEKPLAHSIWEIRQMIQSAKANRVVTQLGNQGHASEHTRAFCEMIRDGAIGKVHTIHAGARAINSGLDQLEAVQEGKPAPPGLDWDLWLGPVQGRKYHPAYLPAKWRGWTPFGSGTVGDWVCHVVDPVFWALDLGAPKKITADVKNYDFKRQGDAYPKGEVITYEFGAKGNRGPIKLVWYSGTERVPRPPDLEPDENEIDTGAAVFGDKGTIVYGSHGASHARIVPEQKMLDYKRPEKTLPRVKGTHREDWLNAIREGRSAGSDFAYGGPLTEIAQLGVIAIKLAGTELEWDGQQGRFTNFDEANSYLKPSFRSGWDI